MTPHVSWYATKSGQGETLSTLSPEVRALVELWRRHGQRPVHTTGDPERSPVWPCLGWASVLWRLTWSRDDGRHLASHGGGPWAMTPREPAA